MSEPSEDRTPCKVVLNGEGQYSLWPADREVPAGWKETGKSGPREECLAYIEEVWTDMRPESLRQPPPGSRDGSPGAAGPGG